MMWFDEIMDDCKLALKTCNDYKGIFAPIFVKLGLTILFGIFLFICGIIIFHGIITSIDSRLEGSDVIMNNLPSIIILGALTYFLIIIGISLMKSGSIRLYDRAYNSISPKGSDFFEGIRKSFFNIFKGTLFIHLVFILISPILLGLFALYSITIGVLSGGWGVLFLASSVSVFFTAWPIIVVTDNVRPLKAIRMSFRLGKKYFWGLFIIMLSNILLSSYLTTILGPLGAFVGGWFLSGIVGTYFNVVVLIIYKRKKELLLKI